MLEILKKAKQPKKGAKEKDKPNRDIFVTKYEELIEYKNGEKIIKRVPKVVNITKKVNETKKLIKNYSAEEKLIELERIFTK